MWAVKKMAFAITRQGRACPGPVACCAVSPCPGVVKALDLNLGLSPEEGLGI